MRFPKCLVFWLTADQEVLDERISTRVDGMIEKGLLDEIRSFYKNHIKKSKVNNPESKTHSEILEENPVEKSAAIELLRTSSRDSSSESENEIVKLEASDSICNGLTKSFEEGLFQAIGFKEFHPFLTYTGDNDKEKQKLLKNSLDRLKQITIKYSKKQKRWVQNRFLGRPKENALSVYELDATDVSQWDVNVFKKAKEISSAFMSDLPIPFESIERVETSDSVSKHRKYVCEICNDRIIIGDDPWEKHLQSKKHKKLKANKNKLCNT